jgi:hypothetical protein
LVRYLDFSLGDWTEFERSWQNLIVTRPSNVGRGRAATVKGGCRAYGEPSRHHWLSLHQFLPDCGVEHLYACELIHFLGGFTVGWSSRNFSRMAAVCELGDRQPSSQLRSEARISSEGISGKKIWSRLASTLSTWHTPLGNRSSVVSSFWVFWIAAKRFSSRRNCRIVG